MKYVVWGLWLIAWTSWALAGVGLERNLPKHADIACTLNLADDEHPLCFLPGGTEFATLIEPRGKNNSPTLVSTAVRIWDVSRGINVRQFDGPVWPAEQQRWKWCSSPYSRFITSSNGVHLDGAEPADDLALLDLVTGDRKSVSAPAPQWWPQYHRTRPWLLCRTEGVSGAIAVVNLETKQVLWRWRAAERLKANAELGWASFLGDASVALDVKRTPRE